MTSLLGWIGVIAADARPLDDGRRLTARSGARFEDSPPPLCILRGYSCADAGPIPIDSLSIKFWSLSGARVVRCSVGVAVELPRGDRCADGFQKAHAEDEGALHEEPRRHQASVGRAQGRGTAVSLT